MTASLVDLIAILVLHIETFERTSLDVKRSYQVHLYPQVRRKWALDSL